VIYVRIACDTNADFVPLPLQALTQETVTEQA
jgi:hypothetical protein